MLRLRDIPLRVYNSPTTLLYHNLLQRAPLYTHASGGAPMKVGEAIDVFLQSIQGEVAPETIRWYKDQLKPLNKCLGSREITTITIRDLRDCRSSLMARTERWTDHPHRPLASGRLSPHTINGYTRAWRRIFRWLTMEGYIDQNPAQRLKPIRTPDEDPKAASEDDIKRLLQVAKDSSPRDYALVCFLVDTGARARGVATLTLERLDLERRKALVTEKSQKRERARPVYFTDITAEALQKWLAVRPDVDHSYVFLGLQKKAPLSSSGIYQILKRLARKAGITGRFNPHSLRHAFARRLLQQGADLGTVSQLMGHSTVDVAKK